MHESLVTHQNVQDLNSFYAPNVSSVLGRQSLTQSVTTFVISRCQMFYLSVTQCKNDFSLKYYRNNNIVHFLSKAIKLQPLSTVCKSHNETINFMSN